MIYLYLGNLRNSIYGLHLEPFITYLIQAPVLNEGPGATPGISADEHRMQKISRPNKALLGFPCKKQ